MYYFNKDNILECSAQISKKRYELEECNRRLSDLVNKLSGDHETASIRRQIMTIRKYINEETQRLDKLEYTLSYTASTYTDMDQKGVSISSKNTRHPHKLVNKMLRPDTESRKINLTVNVVMR